MRHSITGPAELVILKSTPHLIFHNRVLREDGKWRTLDGRLLYRNAAAMVGAALLRAALSQRLGLGWDQVGDNWTAELAGHRRPNR